MLFESNNINECRIFAYGDDATSYKKKKTAKALRNKFSEVSTTKKTEKHATTKNDSNSKNNVSEENYKASCVTISYNDAMRNPDSYKGQNVRVSGKVNQIIEGFFDYYTIYITDSEGNKWEANYKYPEGSSHLIEGDYVSAYGECKGTTNSTTVLGKQVTFVELDLKYIDLIQETSGNDDDVSNDVLDLG